MGNGRTTQWYNALLDNTQPAGGCYNEETCEVFYDLATNLAGLR